MLIDPDHPFFRPLWSRILCTLTPFLWAGVEWTNDQPLWAGIFVAIGLYMVYALFLRRR